MIDYTVATTLACGARSRGYNLKDEDKAMKWFGLVLDQMRAFAISGSAVVMFSGDTEVMREEV